MGYKNFSSKKWEITDLGQNFNKLHHLKETDTLLFFAFLQLVRPKNINKKKLLRNPIKKTDSHCHHKIGLTPRVGL